MAPCSRRPTPLSSTSTGNPCSLWSTRSRVRKQSGLRRIETVGLFFVAAMAGNTVDAVLTGQKVPDVFQAAVAPGVNAKLCDAVAALVRSGHGIGVSISWATVRPAKASDGEFQFAESAADVFSEGAETLRQNSPFLDAHITGEIVGLDRQRERSLTVNRRWSANLTDVRLP